MMRKSLAATILMGCMLMLTACGPTVCDCKDAIGDAASKVISNALEGKKTDLTAEKELAKACREKYGDMSAQEVLDELETCK